LRKQSQLMIRKSYDVFKFFLLEKVKIDMNWLKSIKVLMHIKRMIRKESKRSKLCLILFSLKNIFTFLSEIVLTQINASNYWLSNNYKNVWNKLILPLIECEFSTHSKRCMSRAGNYFQINILLHYSNRMNLKKSIRMICLALI
jgi:hypothetical protein